ncbi:hypothetical protein THAOC_19892, partial [Thalassiosira oceanica]
FSGKRLDKGFACTLFSPQFRHIQDDEETAPDATWALFPACRALSARMKFAALRAGRRFVTPVFLTTYILYLNSRKVTPVIVTTCISYVNSRRRAGPTVLAPEIAPGGRVLNRPDIAPRDRARSSEPIFSAREGLDSSPAACIKALPALSSRDELFSVASGFWGGDGVYPARRLSALYTPTGSLGRSEASIDLKQPSMAICRLRCARDPVASGFS